MTKEIRKPKPKFRPAPLRQAPSAASATARQRGERKSETRDPKLEAVPLKDWDWERSDGPREPQPKRPRGTAEHAKYAEGGRGNPFLSFPRVPRIQRFSSLVENPRSLRAIWSIAVQRTQSGNWQR